ncbi:MAG: flagellar motor protein MotA [Peptococcaceae bacterium BRH_c4a]|nr:MAG: flagellar motor protein MotA [Peptococcaceae bacterium BRH_c4a]
MDLPLILGLGLAVFSLAGAFMLDGGHLGALLSFTAAIIVFGGTLGATAIAFSISELKNIPRLFKIALFPKQQEPERVIDLIVSLADEARREGLLYLENRLGEIDDQFLRKGVQLVVDGTDPELVRSIMEVELFAIEERHHIGSSIFETAGGYAPTMGIIGTVMGLIHVLGNMSDPNALGPAIAVAFMATLYGVGSANVLWLPVGAKLANLSKKESTLRMLMIEGIVSLQAGYNPMLIRERLSAFLNPDLRIRDKRDMED